ncbi:hypothetical protein D3C80_1878080 [compost metagenome]
MALALPIGKVLSFVNEYAYHSRPLDNKRACSQIRDIVQLFGYAKNTLAGGVRDRLVFDIIQHIADRSY